MGVQATNLERVGNLVPGQPCPALSIHRGPGRGGLAATRRPWVEGTRNRSHGAWSEDPEEAKPRRGAERMGP